MSQWRWAVVIVAVFFLIGALSSRNAENAERADLENRAQQEQEQDQAESGELPQDSAEASVPGAAARQR